MFLTLGTKTFFLSIKHDSLDKHLETCNDDPVYKSGHEKLEKTFVENVVAERFFKLIQNSNNILANDETEKQFVLQFVTEICKIYTTVRKLFVMQK